MIHLNSFEAIHYRGIDGLSLPKLSHVNLITGANGVGKTALIEAIWLFTGRYNPRLLWDANVQRSTNPTVNPVSDLSNKSLRLRGTDTNGCDEWKVAFEKAAGGDMGYGSRYRLWTQNRTTPLGRPSSCMD